MRSASSSLAEGTIKMSKIQIISDKNSRSSNIKKSLIKILKKNEVKNSSIILSADYLLIDKELLIGIEYITNLPSLKEEPSATVSQFSVLQGYVYNHNIISLRLGRSFGKKFHLIGSAGIESLSRFASYLDSVEFFINRNKKSTLFNYKIAGFYRFGRFGYEVGLSRRGISGKIMWYINY